MRSCDSRDDTSMRAGRDGEALGIFTGVFAWTVQARARDTITRLDCGEARLRERVEVVAAQVRRKDAEDLATGPAAGVQVLGRPAAGRGRGAAHRASCGSLPPKRNRC